MIFRARRAGRRHTTWSVVAQLELFSAAATTSPQHREPCKQRAERTAGMGRKSEIDLEPVQRIVPAAGATPLASLGPCSVFAMAAALSSISTADSPATDQPAPTIGRIVVREGDRTRYMAVREQDTPEWAEKERQRRARQRPPRPTRQKFKMKGSRTWAAEQQ